MIEVPVTLSPLFLETAWCLYVDKKEESLITYLQHLREVSKTCQSGILQRKPKYSTVA
jgi:hypothetical protein